MKTINEIQNQINTGAGFVTVQDLCKYFNCHKGSIYDAIRKGYLRYINIGKGRRIYITDTLYNALHNVLEYRKKIGVKVKDTDYILTSGKRGYTGKYIAYRTLASGIERLGKRCGIKITSKTFRKTDTTKKLEEGYSPIVVARRLGHTTTKMIETVYGDTDTLYQNAFPLMGKERPNEAAIECA